MRNVSDMVNTYENRDMSECWEPDNHSFHNMRNVKIRDGHVLAIIEEAKYGKATETALIQSLIYKIDKMNNNLFSVKKEEATENDEGDVSFCVGSKDLHDWDGISRTWRLYFDEECDVDDFYIDDDYDAMPALDLNSSVESFVTSQKVLVNDSSINM